MYFKGYRALRHLHGPVTSIMAKIRFNVPDIPLRYDSLRGGVNIPKINHAVQYLES